MKDMAEKPKKPTVRPPKPHTKPHSRTRRRISCGRWSLPAQETPRVGLSEKVVM